MRRFALLLLSVCLGGCTLGPQGQLPDFDRITDWELRRTGAWTSQDAAARRLIGPEWGQQDYRPVRLSGLPRKLASPVQTLFGLGYEKRYHYVPEAHTYVLLCRDRPAVIVHEDWERDTSDRAFEAWREQLKRDLQAVHTGPRPNRFDD